ncbi:MAG: MFS transporter, partial [Alphaproteobacteria bacterium]
LMVHVGLLKTMHGALLLSSASILAMPLLDSFWAWAGLRFLLGCAEATLFVTAETWINQITTDRVRGRVLGIYGMLLAGGIATGPLIIALTGTSGALPFHVGGILPLIAIVPLILVAKIAPQFAGSPSRGMWALLRLVPLAGMAALMFGVLDSAVIGLLPIYGLGIGLDKSDAARLLTMLVLGSVFLQIPIGWLADRVNRTRLIAWITLLGAGALLALPIAMANPLTFYALLFIAGGVIGATWTMSMILLGQVFSGIDLAAMNVVMALLYGLGSIIGPPVSGGAMALWTPHGFTVALGLACLAFSVYAFALSLKPVPISEPSRAES